MTTHQITTRKEEEGRQRELRKVTPLFFERTFAYYCKEGRKNFNIAYYAFNKLIAWVQGIKNVPVFLRKKEKKKRGKSYFSYGDITKRIGPWFPPPKVLRKS